jgi:hypothetical protein
MQSLANCFWVKVRKDLHSRTAAIIAFAGETCGGWQEHSQKSVKKTGDIQ